MKLNDSESNNRESSSAGEEELAEKKCSKAIYINSARFTPALDVTAPARLDFILHRHYSAAK